MKPYNEIQFEQGPKGEPVEVQRTGVELELRIEYAGILPALLTVLEHRYVAASARPVRDEMEMKRANERIVEVLEFQADVRRNPDVATRSFRLTPDESEAVTEVFQTASGNPEGRLAQAEVYRLQAVACALTACLSSDLSAMVFASLQDERQGD